MNTQTSEKKNISDKKDIRCFDFNKFIYIDKQFDIIIEVKHFLKLKDYTDFIKHLIFIIENTIKFKMKMTGITENNIDVFVDLKGYKIKEIDYSLIKMIIKFFEEKYPDNLKTLTLRNPNIMFKTIYAVIRPFIHKDTRQKIFFEKKNKKKVEEKEIENMFD